MTDYAIEASQRQDLRLRAANRLQGTADARESMHRATHSLAVLHSLASSPDTAADALAMLHELQVHQVELDLQAQELRESRAELETALRRQMDLYEFLPVACFAIDDHFVIREVNREGSAMLGVDHDAALGLALDTFVAAESLAPLHRLVASVGAEGRACANLKWRGAAGSEPWVRADVGRDPSGQGHFVALSPAAGNLSAA